MTNRQMDESDFIGCCQANIEHPISKMLWDYWQILLLILSKIKQIN